MRCTMHNKIKTESTHESVPNDGNEFRNEGEIAISQLVQRLFHTTDRTNERTNKTKWKKKKETSMVVMNSMNELCVCGRFELESVACAAVAPAAVAAAHTHTHNAHMYESIEYALYNVGLRAYEIVHTHTERMRRLQCSPSARLGWYFDSVCFGKRLQTLSALMSILGYRCL